jgi:hypothetical protein
MITIISSLVKGQRALHGKHADFQAYYLKIHFPRLTISENFSQLYAHLPKTGSLAQHGEDDSDELVGRGEDRLLEGLSLAPLPEKVGPEHLIVMYDAYRHEPDNPPEMPVPSL